MAERLNAPGDLGRRIARRRESLGLDREQLANRAGIDPAYLAYVEQRAAAPAIETINRLAYALDTSSAELLGETIDLPPGRGTAAWHPELEKLDTEECLRLISPGGVGRLAFNDLGGPMILPVNYVLHEGSVIFRTAFGGPFDANLSTGVNGVEFKIAFEVDRIDDANSEGWSVLIRGGVHHVSTAEEQAAVMTLNVRPWAGGDRELYVKITPAEITGRRIWHGP
ncbi:pyridoxamine 5'-phosphate oxidase family protein [Streptosporangium lutulentum]|uniref:Transcriptional regulator with XRE-family HTH domain n=1 Tax=Streptosporangium lutulentum TaxID=1461250 RepID=A0ABT9QA75_9ACTN|nr:pyridoxamine 5'-phosphate oxidase family protein [Streptosporangium lutulentum]MDP9843660.1 transcriptional regulator with XRE-family HTH domain [Streptosporangium lutulentum]